MKFLLNAEQQELQDTLHRFFSETVTSEYLRKQIDKKLEPDQKLSDKFKELALFEYFSDPEGGSFLELSLVAFESGRVLLPVALADSLLVSAYLSKKCPEKSDIDCSIAAFTAQSEEKLDIKKSGESYTCTGELKFITNASEAAVIMYVPQSPDQNVYIIDLSNSANVNNEKMEALDLTLSRHKLSLKDVPVMILPNLKRSIVMPMIYTLAASELSGIASRVIEMTVEYVQERKQFDVPVGGFQAVQQKLADIAAKSESLEALVRFSSWSIESAPNQIPLVAPAAWRYACMNVPAIIETAIQLHGGIGFTWEHDLHLYLRRARTIIALNMDNADNAEQLVTSAVSSMQL